MAFGSYDNDDVKVKGDNGTDEGQLIGTVGDALKTTAEFTDQSIQDAFGRLRVSLPTIKFDTYFVENERTLTMTKKEATGGTVVRNATRKEMELNVTTSNTSRAAYQSKEYIHYIPGQSTAMEISARFDSGTSGCVQRSGFFDDNNGIFFELDGTSLYTVLRSNISGSVVDTRVLQSAWSLDKMDGTGLSGLTLDITKYQIFYIDYQWLGAGRVRFGLNIGGKANIVDERYHANLVTSAYMQSGSLPLRCEIVNKAVISSTKTLRWLCGSVYNEGSLDTAVSQHSVNRGINEVNVNSGAFTPLISLRLKAANNRATIVPLDINLLSTSNTDIFWELALNSALTAPSWVTAVAEYSISSTASTGGEVITSGYVSKQSNISPRIEQQSIKLVADFDGTVDILTLRAKTLYSNANLLASMSFLELF